MKLQVGDLVHYRQGPDRLGTVVMTHTTITGADICEVIIVCDKDHPNTVGQKRYSNQDYWKKLTPPGLSIDDAIVDQEAEYEEIIGLHETWGDG